MVENDRGGSGDWPGWATYTVARFGVRHGRRAIGRALHVVSDEAQAALFFWSQLDRRRDRRASVVAIRPGATPVSIDRGEIRAQRRERASSAFGGPGLHGQRRRWQALGGAHGGKDSRALCRVGTTSAAPLRERKNPGDDLFSRKAALSVSSALESLTSVFGMGTGVASPLESPGFIASGHGFGSGSTRGRDDRAGAG